MSLYWTHERTGEPDLDRLQRLELPGLGRPVLSRGDGGGRVPGVVRRPLPDRRGRQHVLPGPARRRWSRAGANRTPDGFRFVLKVPQVITHQKQLRDCEEEVDGFVTSILPLGDKLTAALLQLGYFNRGAFASLDDFLDVLDPFLARWPHEQVPLAVEVRNPRWVGPKLAEVLRDHNAALTLTEQTWMPRPAQVAETVDPVTGPLGFVRLLGDRESIEKVTTTWDKVVVDRSADLAETAGVIRSMAERVPVAVFAQQPLRGPLAGDRRGTSGRCSASRSPSRRSGRGRRCSIDPGGGRWTPPVRPTGGESSGRSGSARAGRSRPSPARLQPVSAQTPCTGASRVIREPIVRHDAPTAK